MRKNNDLTHPVKEFPTVGCCGIDCGLCPRYHSKSESRCPGCCGPGFFERHPACPFIRCCARDRGLEVCALCADYPCPRFDREGIYDSFVTHRKVPPNQNYIREHGLADFLEQQGRRMELLEKMMDYNDGRSKTFFYLACTLLPLDTLQGALELTKKDASQGMSAEEQTGLLKEYLKAAAEENSIVLALKKGRAP